MIERTSEATPSQISIPELALVVLVGISGSGKSTFARRHFKLTEVLSSDVCRALVSDDENNQEATTDAFDVLHAIAAKRLARGLLTVIDATNVQPEARRPLIELARTYHCLPVAIVFDLPERLCEERNRLRPDRSFGPHVLRRQNQQLQRSLRGLKREGFRHIFILSSPEVVAATTVERQPLWNNRKQEHGPFDIIGDVHGCASELISLLEKLGYGIVDYVADGTEWDGPINAHPEGRRAVFVGDLVDRGPRILDTLRLVRAMVQAGHALCVPGNHDMKLLRALRGRDVQITHGLDRTLAELAALPEQRRVAFSRDLATFLDDLVSHYVFDDGRLVVAHAGLKESMQGRGSGAVRDFALYGETTGETDEFGLPVRYNWAADYRGNALVVYGHTPVPEPQWLNNTVNIDTGCIFGGQLSALRYPEREIVAVAAMQTYYEPTRPFLIASQTAVDEVPLSIQQQHDDLLDVDDVLGKRIVTTRLRQTVTIREENASAALEVMSRFAVDPRWLIYLPPTMSPPETTTEPGLLEHPAEAFSYYQKQGISRVICEEKHMGSRVIVIVCRDAEAARRCFGVPLSQNGICYTRTGRRFFDQAMEAVVLAQLQKAMERAGWWERFETEWVCLDCELMPWSAKAQELLRQQYAAVGAAAHASLPLAISALQQTAKRGMDVHNLQEWMQERLAMAQEYVTAYRRYCWPVSSISDLKLAPFHLLATEGAVHTDKDHLWHMTTLTGLSTSDNPFIIPTAYQVVEVDDPESCARGIAWWTALTGRGGEGMVVKPIDFVATGQHGLVQPAIKCRGRQYLRIIYGPDYTAPANLERLRPRRLGAKRSLALREFALGIEALERFVRREPLRRVHECVFGILALESEPVDPRL